MHIHINMLMLLIFLASCSNKQQPATEEKEPLLYELDVSTGIVQNLIAQNNLQSLLEECEPDAVARLIKNFSPAILALEAEIADTSQPSLLFFVYKDSPDYPSQRELVIQAAARYLDRIKFIEIDGQELFKVAELFEVTEFPTLLVLKDHEEIGFEEFPDDVEKQKSWDALDFEAKLGVMLELALSSKSYFFDLYLLK